MRGLIQRRLRGESLAYVLGEQEFWSLSFAVDPRVLVPRRDTETLVEVVLAAIAIRTAPIAIADVGTGAGPIAIALGRELAAARIVAIDASAGALEVAATNVARHGLGARIELRRGDLFAPLARDERFDVVAANLPYVASDEIATLSAEVRAEPRPALDGGTDGLDLIRRLVATAADHVVPGGLLALEHGHDQGDATRSLLAVDERWQEATTALDLGGRDRVTWARRR